MTSTLKPVQAVNCPSLKRVVAVTECKDCECVIEVRDPWRHFAVKCSVGNGNGAVYP